MKLAQSLLPISSLVFAILLLPGLSGCGHADRQTPTPDDEAMKRARFEKKTADQAAKEYFLPKYYFDPARKESPVPDYFRGMDPIVVHPQAVPMDPEQPVNQLDIPTFQLFDPDKPAPEFVFATGVKSANEILGRNTWMMWCGGNEGFWDWLATENLGFIDLLKLIDTRNRAQRFNEGGLINEPGMAQNGAADEFGLWLDVPGDRKTRLWRQAYLKQTFAEIADRKHPSQRGLFESQSSPVPSMGSAQQTASSGYEEMVTRSNTAGAPKYGEKDGRSYDSANDDVEHYPPPEIYGVSSGVVGLRLFPNPRFDAEARKKWDPNRYYTDEDYFSDSKLVRPYRVGVACAYCHASFHPLNPPRDVTDPAWENISGNIGAQYLRIRVAFGNLLTPDNFIYHILDSQPPGTIDTSLIATDSINNPNTMNSVFGLPQRALLSFRNPQEQISPAGATQPSLWRHPESGAPPDVPDKVPDLYRQIFANQGLADKLSQSNSDPPRYVPRILLDGSDSIGAWGALARVYLNIGTYYEQWIRIHRPVIGFEKQRPFAITDCEHHSVYWHATQDRVPALRDYFLKATPPMPLAAALVGKRNADQAAAQRMMMPSGARDAPDAIKAVPLAKQITDAVAARVDRSKLARGRKVFARNCIVCHSSIQPESGAVTFYTKDHDRDDFNNRFKLLIDRREMSRADDSKLGELWEHDPGQWLRDKEYLDWAEEAVEKKEFWQLNYLSTDYRIPITLVRTNAGRAMATNALDGSMWDDFASESYQHLPSVGAIDFFNPYHGPNGGMEQFTPRHRVAEGVPAGGGGPGFYRVPTLISIWATAPYLHNNSLGKFTNDPSVEGRLSAFDDSIRKLLWPAKRLESSSYNGATADRLKQDHGLIWRTSQDSYLGISGRRLPSQLGSVVPAVMKIAENYPWLRTIRPLWLPSVWLLVAAFLMLYVETSKSRRTIGWLTLAAAGAGFLVWILHDQGGWFAWLKDVNPLWLPSLILLLTGLVILALDCDRTLRYVVWSTLAIAVLGSLLSWLDVDWRWLMALRQTAPLGWVGFWLALAALVLYATTSAWRHRIAWLALVCAGLGLAVYLHDANLAAHPWAPALGPVWIYSLLLLAASVVLLVPDRHELSRYIGYATLILAITGGAAVYFFNGKLGDVLLGPIPKGTPVNLLTNVNPDADPQELAQAVKVTLSTFAEIGSKHLDDATRQKLLRERVAPALLKVNKCPDFVMDHGHDFEWFKSMTDEDKESLIELLKTF